MLTAGLGRIVGPEAPDLHITDLCANSQTTKPGDLFICLPGFRVDGHNFAADAVARGAVALVVERPLDLPVPQLCVADARAAMLAISDRFFGHPAAQLGLIGITGTNGKTTTAFMLRSILEAAGLKTAVIGTVGTYIGDQVLAAPLTTPDAIDLQRLWRQALDSGCSWVVMEVSSHALAGRRLQPSAFDLGVFTNITRDHFDFHADFDAYLIAKRRLLTELTPQPKGGRPKAAVVNADDPHFERIIAGVEVPVVTFALHSRADVRAEAIDLHLERTHFSLRLPRQSVAVALNLPGRFNVANALAAAATAWQIGLDGRQIQAGLQALATVPGRTEAVACGQPFTVLVDFAHNPDALAKVLEVRPTAAGGRLIVVFGAEGGKDVGKRPAMGEAARRADYCIITSDNMYAEDPQAVAAQVRDGLLAVSPGHAHEVIIDRRAAIARALSLGRPGDVVIIAGKGHERFWTFAGRKVPFDDREVAREILTAMLAGKG